MKVIAMFKRKPGLTPDEFREYYETRHSVLSLKLLPFFTDYRRNYIRHDLGPQRATAEVSTSTFEFDVITEMTFASAYEYGMLLRALADPAVRDQIVEDEKRFIDRSATLSFIVEEGVSAVPA